VSERRPSKASRITSALILASLWAFVLFAAGNKGVHGFWEWAAFIVAMFFIGLNVRALLGALMEPRREAP
jgi:hypothetical protein